MDGRRTDEARSRLASWNAIHKRKYPVGYDTKSRLYRIWRCMYFRCYQTSHEAYDRYGGAGITICPEWLDYATFMTWAISSGYDEHLTIDRKRNSEGYNPGNCQWSTMKRQENNKDNNLLVTAFGEVKSVGEWSSDPRCRVSYKTLWRRVKSGRSLEWALTAPRNSERRRKPMTAATKEKISTKAKARYNSQPSL
jgi:hypothetical protein